MIRKDSIQIGDTVIVKSLVCKKPVMATVKGIPESGVFVDDGSCCGTILAEWHECFYDTKENRKMIVNHKRY